MTYKRSTGEFQINYESLTFERHQFMLVTTENEVCHKNVLKRRLESSDETKKNQANKRTNEHTYPSVRTYERTNV